MADLFGAPHPPAGSPAPDARFATPTGTVRSTREVIADSGGKPTLFAFFKTSCPVCRLDWPYLERLHRAHGGSVRVVGVSQNDPASSQAWYAENGHATFDLLVDPEPAFAASNAFGVESVPHHVLVAPDGTVTKAFAGWSRREIEELDRSLASARGAAPAHVVPEGDPVPAFKPG